MGFRKGLRYKLVVENLPQSPRLNLRPAKSVD